MQNTHRCPASRILTVITTALILLAAAPAGSASATEPSRIVLQIIDNTLHEWLEYDSADDQPIGIYQIKPEEKLLSEMEAAKLLGSSRAWEEEYFSYVNASPKKLVSMADNRTRIDQNLALSYPYHSIGFLAVSFPASNMRGTGFIVGPYTVLTSAHNVYVTSFGGWFKTISFSQAQHETEDLKVIKPFTTVSPISSETSAKYLLYESSGDRDSFIKHDYAALFFEKKFPGITTFIPLEFNYTPPRVRLPGYPGIVQGTETVGMWQSEGPVIKKDDQILLYEAYTSGGSSGSPALAYNEKAGTYRVVAIHSFALADNMANGGGPHLNSTNQQTIEKWLLWTPEKDPPAEIINPEDLEPGDLNADGIINIHDAVLAMQHALMLAELDAEARSRADVSLDGQVNIVDVTLILQYALGIIDTFTE